MGGRATILSALAVLVVIAAGVAASKSPGASLTSAGGGGGGGGAGGRCFDDPSAWTGAFVPAGINATSAAGGASAARGVAAGPLAAFGASHNASLLWGHYRPSVYWGLKTRTWPTAATLGLMWASPKAPEDLPRQDPGSGGKKRLSPADKVHVRHECREGNGVGPFGFDRHDGRGYARQRLTDTHAGVELTTHFAKPFLLAGPGASELPPPPPLPGDSSDGDPGSGGGGRAVEDVEWVARIAGRPVDKAKSNKDKDKTSPLGLLLYVGFDCDGVAAPDRCVALPRPAAGGGGGGGGGDGTAALAVEPLPGGSVAVRVVPGVEAHPRTAGSSAHPGRDAVAWELRLLAPAASGSGDGGGSGGGGGGGGSGGGNGGAAWAWAGVGATVFADLEAHLTPALARTTLAGLKKKGSGKESKDFPRTVPPGSTAVALTVTVDAGAPFSIDLALVRATMTSSASSAGGAAEVAVSAGGDAVAAGGGDGSSDKSAAASAAVAGWRAWVDGSLALHEASFLARFEAVWGLEAKGLGPGAVSLGHFAQSNLLGGLGYFAGSVDIKPGAPKTAGAGGSAPPLPPAFTAALFSATPSRSFFPRGFAWDEGFHHLLVKQWDPALSADALAHWMGTLHAHDQGGAGPGASGGTAAGAEEGGPCSGLGWLPREQIRGEAAGRRVPAQFKPQDVTVANPPTLLLLLDALVNRAAAASASTAAASTAVGGFVGDTAAAASAAAEAEVLATLVPGLFSRASAWLDWMVRSQASKLPAPKRGTVVASSSSSSRSSSPAPSSSSSPPTTPAMVFAWRGRDPHEGKLMPTTFASGLDDYPRALFPAPPSGGSDGGSGGGTGGPEAHVDLLCWLAHGAGLLARVADLLHASGSTAAAMDAGSMVNSGGDYAAAAAKYRSLRADLVGSLHSVHWSEERQAYFDWGTTFDMPGPAAAAAGEVGAASKEANKAADKAVAGAAKAVGFASLGQDVVVSCADAKGQGRQVRVAYDYEPSDPTAAADRQRRKGCPASHPNFQWPLGDGSGGLLLQGAVVAPRARGGGGSGSVAPAAMEARHIGYVTLFPLLLGLLEPDLADALPVAAVTGGASGDDALHGATLGVYGGDSGKLAALLRLMTDPRQLWSPFGLRSLSASDLFYRQANAPGDSPYWRGAVWMPINFLALQALQRYAGHPGLALPLRAACTDAYAKLRANLLGAVLAAWEAPLPGSDGGQGSIWEHYDDVTGLGLRSHPFTGWSALVLNVMAEAYD